MCETQDYNHYDISLLSSRTGEDRNSKQKIIIQCDSGCYAWSFRNRKEKTLKLLVKQDSAGVNGIKEADSGRVRKEEVQVMNLRKK